MKTSVVLFFIALSFLFFTSCSVGRYLDDPAYVFIPSTIDARMSNQSQKYLKTENPDYYSNLFLSEFDNELASLNIMMTRDIKTSGNNVFVLKNIDLSLSESYITETIYEDSLSYQSQNYQIVSCNVSIDFDIYSAGAGGSYLVKTSSAYAGEDEELSTNRTFWQFIFGVNKDNSVYTYKELNSDVFDELCKKTARRSAAKISRVLSRELR